MAAGWGHRHQSCLWLASRRVLMLTMHAAAGAGMWQLRRRAADQKCRQNCMRAATRRHSWLVCTTGLLPSSNVTCMQFQMHAERRRLYEEASGAAATRLPRLWQECFQCPEVTQSTVQDTKATCALLWSPQVP